MWISSRHPLVFVLRKCAIHIEEKKTHWFTDVFVDISPIDCIGGTQIDF